jgi:hypothetical protein
MLLLLLVHVPVCKVVQPGYNHIESSCSTAKAGGSMPSHRKATRPDAGNTCRVSQARSHCGAGLGLQALTILSTASKQLRDQCLAVVCSDTKHLLLQPLASVDHKKQQEAVDWLLRVAPTLAKATGLAECIVQLPAPPLPIAKQLVSAGMRISYKQVLAAAHGIVARVEVWVQAQKKLRKFGKIPSAIVSICC